MKLTIQAWEAAERFIKTSARPLEQALLAFHFQGGPVEAVHDALVAFRNDDGGFGHGLEPDVRLADSSVICTTVALQILRGIGASKYEPNVVSAIRFLVEQYDGEADNWELVPANVNDAAHAPWWNYGPASETSPFNPRAEILAHLLQWPEQVPADMLHNVKRRVLRDISRAGDGMEMHDTLCCIRLLETPSLKERDHAALKQKLGRVVVNTVATKPSEWGGYGLKPLDVAATPESSLAPGLREPVEAHLDSLIDGQGEDGAWAPQWSWAESAPEEWAVAEQEWKGVLTLNALRTLDAWGRLP